MNHIPRFLRNFFSVLSIFSLVIFSPAILTASDDETEASTKPYSLSVQALQNVEGVTEVQFTVNADRDEFSVPTLAPQIQIKYFEWETKKKKEKLKRQWTETFENVTLTPVPNTRTATGSLEFTNMEIEGVIEAKAKIEGIKTRTKNNGEVKTKTVVKTAKNGAVVWPRPDVELSIENPPTQAVLGSPVTLNVRLKETKGYLGTSASVVLKLGSQVLDSSEEITLLPNGEAVVSLSATVYDAGFQQWVVEATDLGSEDFDENNNSIVMQVEVVDPLLGQGWNMIWQDEFAGNSIDLTKWEHEITGWGGGNAELEYYTDRSENSFVQEGKLHLVAIEGDFSGPLNSPIDPTNISNELDPGESVVTQPYSSARLRTKGKADFKYGRMEVRAKLPTGQGLWPAIWMLPTDNIYGNWAASGEIDIMEMVGHEPDIVHGTLHFGGEWPNNTSRGNEYHLTDGTTFNDDFHTFAVEWEPGEIRWYIDGLHFQTQTHELIYLWNPVTQQLEQVEQDYASFSGSGVVGPYRGWFSGNCEPEEATAFYPAPFDQDFHFLLNVAVGGAWPGPPDETTVFPQEMVVDYVRVYQRSEGYVDLADNSAGGDPTSCSPDNSGNTGGPLNVYVDGAVGDGWTLGVWEAVGGNMSVTDAEDSAGNTAKAKQVSYSGSAALFFFAESPQDLSPYLNAGGSLKFDVKTVSTAQGPVTLRIDCGWPCRSDIDITNDLPAVGEWKEISVPLQAFQDAGIEGFTFTELMTAFVLAADHPVELVVANIRWEVDVEPLTIFVDQVNAQWPFYTWELEPGFIAVSDAANAEGVPGTALQVSYSGLSQIYFQSAEGQDLSAYLTAGASLKFDIQVVSASQGSVTARIDCGWPCRSEVDITSQVSTVGEWQEVSIPLHQFESAGIEGFTFTNVNTPLVLLSSGSFEAVVANVRWE